MATKEKAERKLMLAVTSGWVHTSEGDVPFVDGHKYDSSDERVRKARMFFVDAESTSEEIAEARRAITANWPAPASNEPVRQQHFLGAIKQSWRTS